MYVVCFNSKDRAAKLTVRKVYRLNAVVIVDDNGVEVLVDAAQFLPISLPEAAIKLLNEMVEGLEHGKDAAD